jgi:ATP-dependent Clp protease ATP-binding subunit ClpB
MEGEISKLIRLEDHLHKRVIGQHDAVVTVANAVRRSRAGLADRRRAGGVDIHLSEPRPSVTMPYKVVW